MSARYQVLQHEKKPYWLTNCPLLMVTHALTKDTSNNTIFLQCKFQNLNDKKIKAFNIHIECFDVTGQPLTAVDSFSYLDISIAPDKTFGDQTPVPLPNRETRAFHIIPRKIVFDDNSIWENADNQPFVLAEYEQKRISSLGDLADQYKRDLHDICSKSNAHTYLPARKDGFTICGCGKIILDTAKSCPACGVSIDRLFALNNEELLTLANEFYEQNQREQAEQKEKQAAILKTQQSQAELNKKQLYKKVGIISSGVIAIALLGVLTKQVIIPNVQYSNAEHKAQSGEYNEAIQAFTHLGDFKDSSQKVLETKYSWAKDKLAQGDTEGAISLFSTLGNYSDARAQITEIQNQTQYDKAMAAYQSKQYADAQSLFETLGSYKDSAEKVADCKNKIGEAHYSAATTALSKNDTSTALHEFLQAVPYKDSIAQARKLGNFDKKICIGQSCIYYFSSDGSITVAGDTMDVSSVSNWHDLISFSASQRSSANFPNVVIGLQKDGSIVTAGIGYVTIASYTTGWHNLKEVVLGDALLGPPHVVGLKNDGTVVADGCSSGFRLGQGVSWEKDGGGDKCKVSTWKNVKHIIAGCGYTAGLTTNNTVLVTYQDTDDFSAATGWKDIAFLSAGEDHLVGLKTNGTVVATGSNDVSQCDVSNWHDIIAVCTGANHTLGLQSDGTVIATGDNEYGQCNTSDWENVVAIWAGNNCSLALKSDGTLLCAGHTDNWQNDITDWKFW